MIFEFLIVLGGMQDYNYIWHGCMEITLEVSCCKFPYAAHLPRLWDDNKNVSFPVSLFLLFKKIFWFIILMWIIFVGAHWICQAGAFRLKRNGNGFTYGWWDSRSGFKNFGEKYYVLFCWIWRVLEDITSWGIHPWGEDPSWTWLK